MTLREIIELIKETETTIRNPNYKITIGIVFQDKRGKNVLKEVTTIDSTKITKEDYKTLDDAHFEIGDILAISIIKKSDVDIINKSITPSVPSFSKDRDRFIHKNNNKYNNNNNDRQRFPAKERNERERPNRERGPINERGGFINERGVSINDRIPINDRIRGNRDWIYWYRIMCQ